MRRGSIHPLQACGSSTAPSYSSCNRMQNISSCKIVNATAHAYIHTLAGCGGNGRARVSMRNTDCSTAVFFLFVFMDAGQQQTCGVVLFAFSVFGILSLVLLPVLFFFLCLRMMRMLTPHGEEQGLHHICPITFSMFGFCFAHVRVTRMTRPRVLSFFFFFQWGGRCESFRNMGGGYFVDIA